MTVGVFFGGMSCEHDISIITGMQVVSALLHKYNIIPIYISHNGEWYTGKRYFDIDNYKDKSKLKGYRVFLKAGDNMLYRKRGKVKAKLDVAIVCCHGLNGEDGTLQGLLQLSKIPYSGSGVLASSVGMDKVTMKKIFEFQGLPLLPYVKIDRNQYEHDEINVLDTIESKLEYPLIIKPSNLGSSIGISVAQDRQQLLQGLIVAFEWDNTIVVEHALVDFDELNCAVLGGAKFETICSEIEQPKGFDDYLTYDNKYIASNKYSTRNIPANISIEVKHKVQSMAK
ncbi:MAG: D-alanine--D-alanine ligase, partial [Firmicutes bacterium]|nr:D-alanine--D-alanine ligase [Bacillota bacterium]